jgi:hypothetical protein
MLNISYIIPLICFWITIKSVISKYKNELISNNIVSMIHCLLFIICYNYNYDLNYTVHMSIGFYIFDSIIILSSIYNNWKFQLDQNKFTRYLPFIIHHIIGFYLLYLSLQNENKQLILYGYNILETSNIMIYVTYHLHKEYANYLTLNIISEFIQLLWYSYFRIIKFSLLIYQNQINYFNFCLVTQLFICGLYFMGVLWSYKLLKKNIINYTILHKLYCHKSVDSIHND